MIYQWKTGSVHKVDPAVVAEVLNTLAADGQLDPASLVAFSEPEDSPTHPEFDWDDEVCGVKWRLHQARKCINALIICDEEDPEKEPVRAFFKVEAAKEAQYEPTTVLVKSVDGRAKLEEQAKRELAIYRAKFATVLQWTGAQAGIQMAMDMLQAVAK